MARKTKVLSNLFIISNIHSRAKFTNIKQGKVHSCAKFTKHKTRQGKFKIELKRTDKTKKGEEEEQANKTKKKQSPPLPCRKKKNKKEKQQPLPLPCRFRLCHGLNRPFRPIRPELAQFSANRAESEQRRRKSAKKKKDTWPDAVGRAGSGAARASPCPATSDAGTAPLEPRPCFPDSTMKVKEASTIFRAL